MMIKPATLFRATAITIAIILSNSLIAQLSQDNGIKNKFEKTLTLDKLEREKEILILLEEHDALQKQKKLSKEGKKPKSISLRLDKPTDDHIMSCGTQELVEKFKKDNPEKYQGNLKKYNALINSISLKTKKLKKSGDNDICPNGITVIPIAFQVFHNAHPVGVEENYSINDLRLVVDQLNSDFSSSSRLKSEIRPEFHDSEAGHTCIQFAIGKINRINKAQCDSWSEGALHVDLHQCLPGGSGVGSANDPNDYLNIYISDLPTGYLGVASSIPTLYGEVNAPFDGVTINSSVVIPGASDHINYNRGSVLAHEIGHWLGLPHVDGDINGQGCEADDGFSDTYPQSEQRFFYCDNEKIPESCGSVDNVYNFMDYSIDCAKLMFTKEQSIAMQSVLYSERKLLSTSYARKNNKNDLYSNTCQIFGVKPHFEYLVVDCYEQLNLLDIQNEWYPSKYNSDNSVNGLSLFSWTKTTDPNDTETLQAVRHDALFNNIVSHNTSSYTDIDVFELSIQCWDPYKHKYSAKYPAGKLMVIMKRCPKPSNDLVENPIHIKLGESCMNESYLLKLNEPSKELNDTDSITHEEFGDIWFTTTYSDGAGIAIETKSLSAALADPLFEVYTKNGDQLSLLNTPTSSLDLGHLTPGDTAYIRVFDQGGDHDNLFTLCIDELIFENNNCETALYIEPNILKQGNIYHNNGATASGYPNNKALCGITRRAQDVWFHTKVTETGHLTIETFMVDSGISGVLMEVYTGQCGQLDPVGCSSIKYYQPSQDLHGMIELSERSPGEVIFIRIMGQGEKTEGEFKLSVTDIPSDISCRIQYVEVGDQTPCSSEHDTYSQEFVVHYKNVNLNSTIQMNSKSFKLTNSPQTIVIEDLKADGKGINVIANLTNGQEENCWGQSFYKAYNVIAAPETCLKSIKGSLSSNSQ